MLSAKELKSGAVAEISGAPCMIENITKQTPSARGASTIYKVRARNLLTGNKIDQTYRGDDMLKEPDFSKQDIQYSYRDQDTCVFMDLETYEEYRIPADQLEEELKYIIDGQEDLVALILEERIVGIQLPDTVDLNIIETDPSIKGASATARTKPATLETGVVIQVPEYIDSDTVVKVDTRTAKFLGRA